MSLKRMSLALSKYLAVILRNRIGAGQIALRPMVHMVRQALNARSRRRTTDLA